MISLPTFALFDSNSENPAGIAHRNYAQLYFPGLTYDLNISNSLLQLDDINMFREGKVLSEKDKKILTSGNLDLLGSFKTTALDFGYKNWNFSVEAITCWEAKLLDNTYSKIVFYGNELNKAYETHAGKGSEAFGFVKTSVTYAYPHDLSLGMIPGLFPEKADGILGTLKDMPINVGARLNLNRALAYGGVLESDQQFGSMPDSAYYNIYGKVAYSDEDTKGKLSPSFGFGLQTTFGDGKFNFSLDDIGLKLSYDDLAGGEISKVVTDSLLYLQNNFESYEYENIENDSLRISSIKKTFNPSFSIGVEYNFWEKLDAILKYSSSQISNNDGLLVGASYNLGCMPLQAFYGNNGISYYQFNTGLRFNHFEWEVGATFYHGFFRYTKGIGLNSGMVFKF